MPSLTATRGRRLTVAIFGRVNAGKSSLMNLLTGRQQSIVSPVPGTTTDSVEKGMELPDIGPTLFIDTPGIADDTELGSLRRQSTEQSISRADVALLLFSGQETGEEVKLARRLAAADTPVIPVVSRADTFGDGGGSLANLVRERLSQAGVPARPVITVSSREDGAQGFPGRDAIFAALKAIGDEVMQRSRLPLTKGLCETGDTVLLVMPQDREAPVGRLILPQVETIRELLDKDVTVIAATAEGLPRSLAALKEPPKLIITDSQVFGLVRPLVPAGTMLTSFSILFAAQKGDLAYFLQSARQVLLAEGGLPRGAKIVIAEACAHVPVNEDIGRVKIPRLLEKKFGHDFTVEFVNGRDFPESLADCCLVIHCGACMFNRKLVMSRVALAKNGPRPVPMTNYGIAIAALTGILDDVAFPAEE